MTATVIVGLQWGDEGKGKTTDFLAEEVTAGGALPGRRQRRPHRRARRRGLQAPPRPVGRALPAHHAGHRQRRRGQPGHAHRASSTMLAARGIDVDRGPRQHARARDHAVPRRPRRGDGGPPGRRGRGDHAPRHRARPTPTAPGGSGIRMEDLLDGPALRSKLARVLPDKNATLQRQHGRRRLRARAAGCAGDRLGRAASSPHLADTT